MKTKIIISVFSFLLISGFGYNQNYNGNDYLGLPGDNLNLYATLKLFQESETLELFEQKLNDEKSKINNLDLNGDNQIDYIRVIDNVDNSTHVITLQIAVNKYENQDVAVIIVQKDNDNIQIQLIGDEDLYGKDYIIEPNYNDGNSYSQTPNPGYKGNNNYYNNGTTIVIKQYTYYEVGSWPVVRHIYTPVYRPWHSQWYWGYYPSYWSPWNPYYWHYYWGYHYHWNNHYYSHYRHGNYHRYKRWNDYYYGPRRTSSVVVRNRTEKGEYRNTYSKPELAEKGSETYRKAYPNSATAKEKLPDLRKQGNERILNPYESRKSTGNNQNINRNDNNRNGNNRNGNSNYQRVTNPNEKREQPKNDQNYGKPENYKRSSNNNQDVKRANNTNYQKVDKPENSNNTRSRSNNTYRQNTPAPRQNAAPPASRQEAPKSKDTQKKSDKRN